MHLGSFFFFFKRTQPSPLFKPLFSSQVLCTRAALRAGAPAESDPIPAAARPPRRQLRPGREPECFSREFSLPRDKLCRRGALRAGCGGADAALPAPTAPFTSDSASKIPTRASGNEAGQLPRDLISPPAIPRPAGPAASVGVGVGV